MNGCDGLATGVAVGASIAMMEREEERNKKRRLSNMGHDQIVYESPRTVQEVGESIAKTYDRGYFSKNKIMVRNTGSFNLGISIMCGLIVGLVLTIAFISCNSIYDKYDGSTSWARYPLSGLESLIVCTVIGAIAGFVVKPFDYQVDYIRLSEIKNSKNKTRILIKVYSSDGSRNIDEDELMEIKESLGCGQNGENAQDL